MDTHRSTVAGQPPGRRKYPAAPASVCEQPRMKVCTKLSTCTKFELSVRQPITLSVSLAELSTRRSHWFDNWNPTLSTAQTDPRDTQMPMLQAWKFPPTTMFWSALKFDVLRPATAQYIQKQLMKIFSDPM